MKKIQMLRNILLPRHSSNQRGFTLVEIMVAIGIMSTISLALIKMNEMMNKTSKNMSQQLDATQLMAQLDYALRDSSGCFETFGARTLVDGGVATAMIEDPNGNALFAVPGGTFGDLTFVSATFRNIGAVSGPVITIDNPATLPPVYAGPVTQLNDIRERTAQVRLVLRKGRSANAAADHQQTVGTQNIVRDLTFRFYVRTGTPTIVAACSGNDSEYLDLACDLFNGTMIGSDCRNITVASVTATTGVAATFTERVAIARTAAPSAASLLEVGSGTYPVGALPGINVATGGNSYVSVSDNTRQVLFGVDASDYGMVGTYSNHDFVIRSNNVERVRVTAAGNVGINAPTPTTRLDVRGQVNIDSDANYDVWIQGGSGGGGANRNLALLGVKATDTLYLNYDGEYTGGVQLMSNLNVTGSVSLAAAHASGAASLCYKGACITSWNVRGAGGCTTVYSSPGATAYCSSGFFVHAVGSTASGDINILCCPARVY